MLHGSLLRVYDFDGSLLRSPHPPDSWPPEEQDRWWRSSVSLGPPVVPEMPGDDWWVPEVEASMRADLQRRECGVIVLTGRTDGPHRLRIGTLLRDRGLVPNALFLNDTGADTVDHKISKILLAIRLSRRGFERIDMWEDNHENLERYRAFFEAQGVPFSAHPVHSTPMPWTA